jgi:hypothetical protein
MVSVYGGSKHWSSANAEFDLDRFRQDLVLSSADFELMFDTSLSNPYNYSVLKHAVGAKPAQGISEGKPQPVVGPPSSLSKPTKFLNRPPAEFINRAQNEPDFDRRMRLLERATNGHRAALNRLANLLTSAGHEISEQLDGFDLYGTSGDKGYLFEVKTWTSTNLAKQVRSGWAQLYEYRYRNAHVLCADTKMFLVMDRPPPPQNWVWTWLGYELGVVPCWLDEDALATLSEFELQLPSGCN